MPDLYNSQRLQLLKIYQHQKKTQKKNSDGENLVSDLFSSTIDTSDFLYKESASDFTFGHHWHSRYPATTSV
jgi:hypothetical protein